MPRLAGLHYSAVLDCLAVFELAGSELSLYDVVATEMPSLDSLLSQIPAPIEAVRFYFSPERFDIETSSEPYRFDGDYFMVRGPFAAESRTFMIPPPARH